jgi:hypothetical protein
MTDIAKRDEYLRTALSNLAIPSNTIVNFKTITDLETECVAYKNLIVMRKKYLKLLKQDPDSGPGLESGPESGPGERNTYT